MICAPSEDSDQPGHLPSLISLHFRLMGSLGPILPSGRQRRLRSDWEDTQADLTSRDFVGFVVQRLIYVAGRACFGTKQNSFKGKGEKVH